jgi:beta-N-acetylhexosaminidase
VDIFGKKASLINRPDAISYSHYQANRLRLIAGFCQAERGYAWKFPNRIKNGKEYRMGEKEDCIKGILSKMTLGQKVGQCLVIGFTGTVITPRILHRIRNYFPAGIRTGLTFRIKSALHDPYAYNEDRYDRVMRTPEGTVKDFVPGLPVPFCTNGEYCRFLNTLKHAALDNGLGVPLHITLDMEGDASCDYFRGGIRTFPSAMGIALTDDPRLAYDHAWAVSRQINPLGFSWIHSPVLDVNSNPMNPEIGTRSYGENAFDATRFARMGFRGFRDGGIITTGKHFPGRGFSGQDAHRSLPSIGNMREELEEHLSVFQALIDDGIPCVMTAHTAYPALDPSGLPATLSKRIVTDLLKGRMGFKGTVTTDDITMGGIIERYEPAEACILALNAGCDLVLFRDESGLIDEIYPALVDAARKGYIGEERLNDAVTRTLSVKYDYGLFRDSGIRDENMAGDGIRDPRVRGIAKKSAEKTVRVLRDRNGILPLKPETRVLLIEQIHPLHGYTNTQECHPGLLWEHMLAHSDQVGMVEVNLDLSQQDKARVTQRLHQAEVIVMTNYYFRRFSKGNNDFVRRILASGKPLIVVANTHYEFSVLEEYPAVVLNYGASPESFKLVADILYGAGRYALNNEEEI